MPRVGSQDELLPSLLDRLIDLQPEDSTEPKRQRAQLLRQFEAGVLRDVEALLNTRQTRPALPADFEEVAQSVLTYGMPDFSTAEVGSADALEELRQAVERALTLFEPRIRQIRVSLRHPSGEHDRTLRMVIEGLLWILPDPQLIAFDTLVKPVSGQCTVESR